MKHYGEISELSTLKLRTTSDNKEVSIAVPTTLSGASLTLTTPNVASGTTDRLLGRLSTDTGADRLQNKELSDDNVRIVDAADTTKKIEFDASVITTGNTRVFGVPDANDTLVGIAATQTLTNKSIDSDNNTITNIVNADIKATAAIALSKLATVTASRALESDGSGLITASTVTSTELGQLSGIGSAAVGISDTQTLTNKDIDGGTASNSLRITVPKNTTTNLNALTRKEGTIVYDTTTGQMKFDNGATLAALTAAGGTEVTATSTITDNSVVRGDGGSRGVQTSSVLIDDSDNVTGIASLTATGTLTNTGSTSLDGAVVINESGADVDFRVEGDTDTDLFFVDASTDRVGISTSTPGSLLDVTNDSSATGIGCTTSNNVVTAGHFIHSGAAPTADVFKIDTAKANSGSANFNYIHIQSDYDGTPNTEFRLAETGQIVVNTTYWGTGGTAVGVSSNVLTTSPSSLRYKENVQDLSTEVDTSKIYNLRPVTFDYKKDGRHSFGLIAEEVVTEVPCIVHQEADEQGTLRPESVAYDHLSVLLLEEIKKLRARIEVLEGN